MKGSGMLPFFQLLTCLFLFCKNTGSENDHIRHGTDNKSHHGIDNRMLLQKQGRKNDKNVHDMRRNLYAEVQPLCANESNGRRYRAENVHRWADVCVGIVSVKIFHEIHEKIVTRKAFGAQTLNRWVGIIADEGAGVGYHYEIRHFFEHINVVKKSVCDRKDYVQKPENVRNDKKLVEGYHVVYRQVHLVKFDAELVEKLVVMLFHKPKKRAVYRPIQKKQKMSVSFAEKVMRAQL